MPKMVPMLTPQSMLEDPSWRRAQRVGPAWSRQAVLGSRARRRARHQRVENHAVVAAARRIHHGRLVVLLADLARCRTGWPGCHWEGGRLDGGPGGGGPLTSTAHSPH